MLSAADGYNQAALLFQHGQLEMSERLAGTLADRFSVVAPASAARLRIVEAKASIWRGTSQAALTALQSRFPDVNDSEIQTQRLALIALAYGHLHQFDQAERSLDRSFALCSSIETSCIAAIASKASLAMQRGDPKGASTLYMQELVLARKLREPFEEATILANLAVICMIQEKQDQAIDLLRASDVLAVSLKAEDILQNNSGNLGWAYYRLGDAVRALALFQDAEHRAELLGDFDDMIVWLYTSGSVYEDAHDSLGAARAYGCALALAKATNNREKIINSLESLANVSIDAGNLQDAERYLRELDPLIRANENHLDALDVTLARGRIAAARRQDQQAEALFHQVEADPASQITMKLGAEHELARLYEAEGRPEDAEKEYETALSTFESARAAIKNEDSKLPYFANATPIYDDYIRLLISQGKTEDALAAADQSRARTLEQGLGIEGGKTQLKDAGLRSDSLRPGAIAAKSGATLLFYWIGEKQSWLWAITPHKTQVSPLPGRAEIARRVERYRQELLGPEDPLRAGNEDGRALYRMLVSPAKDLLAPGGKAVVLCDGVLSELNFETLLVDGARPHYWIEDAEVESAPSLRMVAAGKSSSATARKLLLVGDAVSPGPDYPQLPNAPVEMREIQKHFEPGDATVFARGNANPAAYLGSNPRRFAYIDFVAHGVASRTDPLDSAIILSRTRMASQAGEDSFKLYAREIMQHPIDARLVTIAACYGGGTRSYAGEGLVGLSWAFLRAGAHNVIGALWEVSDESAPRLMDALYQGLQDGLPPGAALRAAKLKLLHGTGAQAGEFRRPFYWGSFQLYSVQ